MTLHSPFVETAAAIAANLTSTAIWNDDRCSWLGVDYETPFSTSATSWSYGSLSPWLYNGTSGIGTFLAEFAHQTDDPIASRTAAGALRHAARNATLPPSPAGNGRPTSPPAGLFDGLAGVALACVRAATLLADEELLAAGTAAAHQAAILPVSSDDLLSGTSGIILALHAIAQICPVVQDRESYLRAAQALCDKLTHPPINISSWRLPAERQRPLTGLAHGASGIVTALAEALRTNNDPSADAQYRAGLHHAVKYESSTFDGAINNWPDYRNGGVSGDRTFMTAWCHGGPGIALARLVALGVQGEAQLRIDAHAGLTLAHNSVASALRNLSNADLSLCHGAFGNAEILLAGHQLRTPLQATSDRVMCEELATLAAARFGAFVDAPSGNLPACPPGLMLGRAGFGLWYLRLAAPGIPSVICPASSREQANIAVYERDL